METLNLNTLASSLPTVQQKAEQELLNNFKASALSITTLYRSSRQNAKRAYDAGYAAACQDLLTMIQQGVSAGSLGGSTTSSPHDADNDGVTISRVMDWVEARLEAIRAREEEEEEEEEREKERERSRATPSAPQSRLNSKPNAPAPNPSSNPLPTSLPTPSSPPLATTNQLLAEPTTPSPPLLPVNASRLNQRSKPRTSVKGESSTSYANLPTIPSQSVFSYVPDIATSINSPIFPETPAMATVGSKRRHAMMMMLDGAPTSVTPSSVLVPQSPASTTSSPASQPNLSNTLRRRPKSIRGLQQLQNQNINITQPPAEAMEIEDDGRERKRVARR